MTSPVELDRFLAELGGRRARLLELVDSQDPGVAALVEELTDLGEQLIVADEELRVQQEELTEARSRWRNWPHERELLFQSSTHPYVLTDQRGVVQRANRAADRLIRQPAARRTPRPIATWFEVADRPAMRGLISALTAGRPAERPGPARSSSARTGPRSGRGLGDRDRRPGFRPHRAAVGVRHRAGGRRAGRCGWSPIRIDRRQPSESCPPDSPLATELAECENEDELLAITVERATELPAADEAGVVLLRRRGGTPAPGPVRRRSVTDSRASWGRAPRSPRWTSGRGAGSRLRRRSALAGLRAAGNRARLAQRAVGLPACR